MIGQPAKKRRDCIATLQLPGNCGSGKVRQRFATLYLDESMIVFDARRTRKMNQQDRHTSFYTRYGHS
jgi:hypothetical protein